ncbi:hypothetical protein [Streptomyces olivochromogenes]|uniref:hypothetical protein n=1 Tax=Streptomyces olivochromogenes TaxID=1963 RepID=UPI001F24F112|nr:hypothetical protein [Streptomyces olivochromogenes]
MDAAFERGAGLRGIAENAIDDTLTFVPFRKLPAWFRWRWSLAMVRGTAQGCWLRTVDAVGDVLQNLRGRRS